MTILLLEDLRCPTFDDYVEGTLANLAVEDVPHGELHAPPRAQHVRVKKPK
jgi:hypothetical protein